MKHLMVGVMIAILILLGVLVFTSLQDTPLNTFGGNYFTTEFEYFDNASSTVDNKTTSTVYGLPINLTAGGTTSTASWNCSGVESIDMNLLVEASSTASRIMWTFDFSHDGIDYFNADGYQVEDVNNVTHGAGDVVHSWTPGTVATSTKNVAIEPVASQYCRININTAAANASFWANIVSKQPF